MSEGKLRLIPVYDKYALMKAWGYIIEGVEEILEHSEKDTSLSKVFNLLLGGHLTLWIWFLDDQYAGFMTTRVEAVPHQDKFLWLVHLFSKQGISKEVYLKGMDALAKHAKENDCKFMKTWTKRPKAIIRKTNGYWREGYTELVHDFKDKG